MSGPGDPVGDGQWAALYGEHGERLVAFTSHLVGDPHLAQDLAHDVFVLAGARMQSGGKAPDWRWLHEMATELAVRHRRSRRPEVRFEPAQHDTVELDHYPSLSDARLVRAAFVQLAKPEQVALRLRYDVGLESKAAAAFVLMSEWRFSRLLARAERHLRDRVLEAERGLPPVAGVALLLVRRLRARVGRLHDAARGAVQSSFAWLESLPTWAAAAGGTAGVALVATVVVGGSTLLDEPSSHPVRFERSETPSSRAPEHIPQRADREPLLLPVPLPPAALVVHPHVTKTRHGDIDKYTYEPVDVIVTVPENATEETSGSIGLFVGFECPPPEERDLTLAVSCSVLEATHAPESEAQARPSGGAR